KFNFWSYKVTLPNRTGTERKLTVTRVKTIAKVKIDVAGKEREVEVPLVDDGKMNVYKAAFCEAEGLPITTNRFPKNKQVAPARDQAAEFTVVFRERDVDFAAVLRNVHNDLDLEKALERNKASEPGAKPDKKVFEKARQLTAKEVAAVRDQLKEKLPAALQDQLAKTVVAEFTVKSGLSSGVRRINLSLYKPVEPPAAPE
ncbi:MAG: hypothetical protein PVI87_06050, partial [Gammaproteobacteria bacterium]